MTAAIAAVILSGGSSARMGSPKALLAIDDTTFIGKILRELASAPITETIIVLGADDEAIRPHVNETNARIVINDEWKSGRLSSIIAGVDALKDSACTAVLIWPVDHPLVSATVVRAMMRASETSPDSIIIPVYRSRRGHPIILPRRHFDELRHAPAEQGLRSVVHAHTDTIIEVETDECGVLVNIDTPEDYAAACRAPRM